VTYAILAGALLLVAVGVRGAGELVARRRGQRIAPVPTVIAAAVLCVLTIVFDNLMIAAGLFTYAEAHLAGIRIGLVPVEDLSYPLALAIALPGLWQLIPERRRYVERKRHVEL